MRSIGESHPGLLISVRNVEEAEIAWQGGADVIDIKEPLRGSLGAPDREAVRGIAQFVNGRCPISVAGGELLGVEGHHQEFEPWPGVDFVKLGLAGCGSLLDWQLIWQRTMDRFRGTAAAVAVVYADWKHGDAPSPPSILAAAMRIGAPALLVDTFDKTHGNLFDHWPAAELSNFVDEVRSSGRLVVLAGSLRDAALRQAAELRPDLVAVRGAVCDGDRGGNISRERVCEIRNLLKSWSKERSEEANNPLARILPISG